MADGSTKLAVKEKLGYACGDIATNFFFQSMILYQTRFYTDTAGLAAKKVAFMLGILRLADAVFDPVIGALSDRTQTRWGKFRPWLLWTALPFGLIFWIVYVTPDFGPQAKLIYAYLTYSLMMMYSANNTPYSALMAVMTPDDSERSSVASYRFVGALIGQFIIQALPLPLVEKLGHGNSARGWAMTMAIFAALIVLLNLIAFVSTRERLQPPAGQKSSLWADIKNVFTCRPWVVMFILTLLVFTTLVVRGSSLNYFFSYYMDQGQLRDFLGRFGLAGGAAGSVTGWRVVLDSLGLLVVADGSNASAVGFSLFNVLSSLVQIVGILFSKPLAARFGKKTVFIAGMGVTSLATVLVFWITPTAVAPLFWLNILWAVGWGPTVPLLWVMIADVADYSEWKNFRRATGFMFAGILFALKAGLGLGGALSASVIDAYGYKANEVQTPHALLGIRLGASVFPAAFFALGLVCLIIYPIGKAMNQQMQNELTERRKQYAAPNPVTATS